jgi:hypothetical protein
MELSCERCVDRLGDYVEDALPSDQHAEVSEHLAGCVPCREVIDECRRVSEVVRGATDVPMPPDARARLRRIVAMARRRRSW